MSEAPDSGHEIGGRASVQGATRVSAPETGKEYVVRVHCDEE